MKLLKFIPVLLLFVTVACSSDDEQNDFNAFVGNWELSNFKWTDCEEFDDDDDSVEFAVPVGGCFFEGCYSIEIVDESRI